MSVDPNGLFRFFSIARDQYASAGFIKEAKECDQAIALTQRLFIDPRLDAVEETGGSVLAPFA